MNNPTPPRSTVERADRVHGAPCGFCKATRASHELELDLAGFLRGDPETRWKSHEIAVKNRVLTPNEVRVVEGWNPRDGGDDFPHEVAPDG